MAEACRYGKRPGLGVRRTEAQTPTPPHQLSARCLCFLTRRKEDPPGRLEVVTGITRANASAAGRTLRSLSVHHSQQRRCSGTSVPPPHSEWLGSTSVSSKPPRVTAQFTLSFLKNHIHAASSPITHSVILREFQVSPF